MKLCPSGADCQSVSRLWRNGSVLYRQVGWWCHHELYPAKAGAAGLCHRHRTRRAQHRQGTDGPYWEGRGHKILTES